MLVRSLPFSLPVGLTISSWSAIAELAGGCYEFLQAIRLELFVLNISERCAGKAG